jgi:hypothetical protein
MRARISYAFRVFAAVYGHTVVEDSEGASSFFVFYGAAPPASAEKGSLYVPALYQEHRTPGNIDKAVKRQYAGEEFHLTCGWDAATARPDWLGELFLWLSSSYERNVTKRDDVGRIPYSEMIFVRERLSPRKAHAARLMAWLENALQRGDAPEALPKAPSPEPGVEHLIVCSHDIDFYYTDRRSAWTRLVKNLGAAVLLYRSASFFKDNLRMMLQLLSGGRPGQYLPPLRQMAGGECNFGSTMFVVPRQGHRRDPNYRLAQLRDELPAAAEKQFSVEVHGSYRSVMEDHTLAAETRDLRDLLQRRPLGNRQHWLRFSDHQILFDEIERAGLLADSTLGFSETVGFRNGACFAFPPYNFAEERPCNFLEIPLVLMDGSLEAASREEGIAAQPLADEILAESRKYSWGGVSILWHNPIEQLSVPASINAVFWQCAKQQRTFQEKWLSLEQFLACATERYRAAGLLAGTSSMASVDWA